MENEQQLWERYFRTRYHNWKERARWHFLWKAAIRNMPAISEEQRSMGLYGQQSALARCLGYKKSKGFHNSVFSGWQRGSKPDGKRAELLEQLAGPDGVALAEKLLAKDRKKYRLWLSELEAMGCVMHLPQ